MEEQWLFRPAIKPLCSLKRRELMWESSLLIHPDGIGASMLHVCGEMTLAEAKKFSEEELKHMGWKWS